MRECTALLFGPSPSSTMSENSVGQKRQAAPTLTQASTSQEVGIWLGSVLTPEELQELWVDDIDGAALLASTVRTSKMLVLSSISVVFNFRARHLVAGELFAARHAAYSTARPR